MTIRDSLYFSYDGISSQTMGILNVNLSGGMLEENFLPEREIIQTKVRGRLEPYYHDVEYSPLKLELNFVFENNWDEESIRTVKRWLCQDFYKELYFSENPNKRYYAMYTGNPNLIHNALKQGYVTMTFETNSPFAYSPVMSEIYNLSTNTVNGTDIVFTNHGDTSLKLKLKPLITVEIVSGTGFKIINNSNGGELIEFTGLTTGEILTIDCENKDIETSLSGVYRYDKMTTESKFLTFPRGVNNLKVYGNIKLNFKFQYRIM